MKIKSVITIILTVIFFAGMAVLTFTAREVHNASLPRVKARRLSYEFFPFEYTDENGETQTGMSSKPAIDSELLDGDIYILIKVRKNGEERDYVSLVQPVTGDEYNGKTAVTSGLYYGQGFVADSDGELSDNCEVVLIEE